jgi:riboflavin synthase
MFTGIVEELGTVAQPGVRLRVMARTVAPDCGPGASLAVSGVCLTVVERLRLPGADGSAALAFDLSDETLARTSLADRREGDRVNLERPVPPVGRLGGHLVQGHVDGVGVIRTVAAADVGRTIRVGLPTGLGRYVAEKGSITIDGVSLTVTDVAADALGSTFGVALIPFTLEATTLGMAAPGDRVNLEVDVIARYVERLLRVTG